MYYVLAVHFVENAIAADDNEIVHVLLYLELNDVGVGYDNVSVAADFFIFGFDVTKSS